ncbi:MAG: hypothetical protein Q8Q32_02440 [bacterium]|nr:hypothetical protein [bacterium]
MYNDMLGRAVRQLVHLPASILGLVIDLLVKLSSAEFHRKALPHLQKLLSGEFPICRPLRFLKPLLEQESPKRFSADATFFAKESVLKIAFLSDHFRAAFSGKEEQVTGEKPQAFSMPRTMTDSAIIADLGGVRATEISLSQVWEMLLRQPKGEEGLLLTNGVANIFYVRDAQGMMRAVRATWYDVGWHVGAAGLDFYHWRDGHHVFSSRLSDTYAPE